MEDKELTRQEITTLYHLAKSQLEIEIRWRLVKQLESIKAKLRKMFNQLEESK